MKRHCEEELQKPARLPAGNLFAIITDSLPCFRLLADPCKDVLALLLVLISLTSHATIHTVKQDGSGDHTTIQAGINAASTGDTVLVWPGTYFENIDYNSKSITVASLYLLTQDESYINSTIIDGNMNGSCVVVNNCNSDFSFINGFTIQHGSGSTILKAGGGIFINGSLFHIKNCIIKNCECLIGGGIGCLNSTVLFSGSIVKHNKAINQTGGIIVANNSEFIFDTIHKNSVFLNFGPKGCDVSKTLSASELHIVLDTGTVLMPDNYFYFSQDQYGNPLDDLSWSIFEGKLVQVNSNLYVSVNGNNENSGLTPSEPLKSISYAIAKILPDTLNPKSINLGSGVYSASSNNEILPINQRSFVSIIGTSFLTTIIDGELLYPLYYSKIFNKKFNIENIQFTRGTDSQEVLKGNGGLNIVENEDAILTNLDINSCEGSEQAGIRLTNTDVIISDTKIHNNTGGNSISSGNIKPDTRIVKIFNTLINQNIPDQSLNSGFGGGIVIVGSYASTGVAKCNLFNVEVSQNYKTIEPGISNYGICGIGASINAKVNVVNSTIGNNEVTNQILSSQVGVDEGAEINFYNSIVYGAEDYEIFLGDGTPTSDIATINISNTDVKGGEESIQNWNNIHMLNWLDGNIDEDPLWEGGEPFSYALQPGSPCIDAGVPMYETGMEYPYIKEENGKYVLYMLEGDTVTLPAYDLAGNPRISGGRIDMGAYEWQDTATGSSKFEVGSSKFGVYPNPFTSNVFVSFSLSQKVQVRLEVIDMKGQLIKTFADAGFPAGTYKLVWNGKDDDGYAAKKGNYLMCLYFNGILVDCEKMIKTISW
ncbi:MAG TPA: FlgD immunoglobulin-like domain containing protein [Bacteroidales bacterium]|nr:FlgD immunoglobulin-like domain containing protein [Bacteroidales bacterium]HRX96296.1 FlgD immunoglobulin-like domain containing protein [Bacteroidales bacterium]